jgi:hypothetical protein
MTFTLTQLWLVFLLTVALDVLFHALGLSALRVDMTLGRFSFMCGLTAIYVIWWLANG